MLVKLQANNLDYKAYYGIVVEVADASELKTEIGFFGHEVPFTTWEPVYTCEENSNTDRYVFANWLKEIFQDRLTSEVASATLS